MALSEPRKSYSGSSCGRSKVHWPQQQPFHESGGQDTGTSSGQARCTADLSGGKSMSVLLTFCHFLAMDSAQGVE